MTGSTAITIEQVRADPETRICLTRADENLDVLGYTEHGDRHASAVAATARHILTELRRDGRVCELAEIAGYLHDVGNLLTRVQHGTAAALIAHSILTRLGMPVDEVVEVMRAIGNHEEEYGTPVSDIAAAVILGDKSDVRFSRVRDNGDITGDIHDRVNSAARSAEVTVDPEKHTIALELKVDTDVAPLMEYFEAFLARMVMCRRAAAFLGCDFHLVINEVQLE